MISDVTTCMEYVAGHSTLVDELNCALLDLSLEGNGVIQEARAWQRVGRRKFEARLRCYFPERHAPEQHASVLANIGENFGSLRMRVFDDFLKRPVSEPFFDFILSDLNPFSDGVVSPPHSPLSWLFSLPPDGPAEQASPVAPQAPMSYSDAERLAFEANRRQVFGFNGWRLPSIDELLRLFPRDDGSQWLPAPHTDKVRVWSSDVADGGDEVWTYSPFSSIGEDRCPIEVERSLVLIAERSRW